MGHFRLRLLAGTIGVLSLLNLVGCGDGIPPAKNPQDDNKAERNGAIVTFKEKYRGDFTAVLKNFEKLITLRESGNLSKADVEFMADRLERLDSQIVAPKEAFTSPYEYGLSDLDDLRTEERDRILIEEIRVWLFSTDTRTGRIESMTVKGPDDNFMDMVEFEYEVNGTVYYVEGRDQVNVDEDPASVTKRVQKIYRGVSTFIPMGLGYYFLMTGGILPESSHNRLTAMNKTVADIVKLLNANQDQPDGLGVLELTDAKKELKKSFEALP